MKRLIAPLFLFSMILFANDASKNARYEWSMISALRVASVPYQTDRYDDPLSSYALLLFLDNGAFYSDGLEGGLKFYQDPSWRIAVMGKMHFVDMPRHDSRYFHDDTVDMGLSITYFPYPSTHIELQLLTDPAWRPRTDLRVRQQIDLASMRIEPYVEAGLKSSEYNTHYFGINDTAFIKPDVEVSTGARFRWWLDDDIMIYASGEATWLGSETGRAATIRTPIIAEAFIGAGIYQMPKIDPGDEWMQGFLRLALGEATPSSFSENLMAKGSRDLNRNYVASLFYGLPISKTLFGTSIQTYFTPGFVHHFASDVQVTTQEYVTAFKFFYKMPSWWLRIGVASGLSYIRDITFIERYINEKDGYERTSHLMHHLDFSFDFELSHLFGESFHDYWFGYSLHHRSGIFESAKQYGNIKGGSNYNTVYVQYHFEN